MEFSGQEYIVSIHSLLQGILSTQGQDRGMEPQNQTHVFCIAGSFLLSEPLVLWD